MKKRRTPDEQRRARDAYFRRQEIQTGAVGFKELRKEAKHNQRLRSWREMKGLDTETGEPRGRR